MTLGRGEATALPDPRLPVPEGPAGGASAAGREVGGSPGGGRASLAAEPEDRSEAGLAASVPAEARLDPGESEPARECQPQSAAGDWRPPRPSSPRPQAPGAGRSSHPCSGVFLFGSRLPQVGAAFLPRRAL